MKSIALKAIATITLLASASVAFALPPNDTSLCQSAMQADNLAACLQINATTSSYVTPNMGYMVYVINDGFKEGPLCTMLTDTSPSDLIPSASSPSVFFPMTDDYVQSWVQMTGVGNHSSQVYVQTTQGNYTLVSSGSITFGQDPTTKKFFMVPAVSSVAFAWPANPQTCTPQSSQGATQLQKLLFR